VYICCYICVLSLALNMGDDRRRVMYDGFDSVTGASHPGRETNKVVSKKIKIK
jgi:hypothetical protein